MTEYPQSPLRIEEQEHYQGLLPEVRGRLAMVSEGLAHCQLVLLQLPPSSKERLVLQLIGLKALDHLRGAQLSIEVGCHQSVPVLLQLALTSTGTLLVAKRNRKYRDKWIFFTSVGSEHFAKGAAKKRFDSIITGLERRAVRAYDALTDGSQNSAAVSELVRSFGAHTHPSLEGLFEGMGILTDDAHEFHHYLLDMFFPKDGEVALEQGEGGPDTTFNTLWERIKGRKRPAREEVPGEEGPVEDEEPDELEMGLGSARPSLAEFHSAILLGATHHLYDILKDPWGKSLENDARDAADNWHKRVLDSGLHDAEEPTHEPEQPPGPPLRGHEGRLG